MNNKTKTRRPDPLSAYLILITEVVQTGDKRMTYIFMNTFSLSLVTLSLTISASFFFQNKGKVNVSISAKTTITY